VLHYAAILGNIPMARMLLHQGANANTSDIWGFSPSQARAFSSFLL
jgi:ankyrin repeat protein